MTVPEPALAPLERIPHYDHSGGESGSGDENQYLAKRPIPHSVPPMIRFVISASLLTTALCLGPPAAAKGEPGEEIVVAGSKASALRDLRSVLRLVDGHVARFDETFCPRVMGLDAELTRLVEARIAANAARVGLIANQDCKPTAFVIFIEQPRELMRKLRDRRPDLFRLRGMRGTVTAMIRQKQPYYAWRAVVQRTQDGRDTGPIAFVTPSRIGSPRRYDITSSYAVIDIERTVGATTTQLADFATMQLLNNTGEASSRSPAGSIVGLFAQLDPATGPAEMSAFDRALLAGLYDRGSRNLDARAQRGRIAARIVKEEAKPRPEIDADR